MSETDEKTEKPTAKKLKDARKDGRVARSSDLTDAISMAAVVGLLGMGASQLADVLRSVVTLALLFVDGDHSLSNINAQLFKVGTAALAAIVPCICAAALGSLVASISQVGFKIAMKPVTPNLAAINPTEGVKRIFSQKTLIDLVKMLVKGTLVFSVMWVAIKWLFPLIVASLYQPLPGLIIMIWGLAFKLLMIGTAIFVLTGAADVRLQSFLFLKKMKMSKDEVKREFKHREGDPRIKGERKRLAREFANAPMASRVGHANMMLVNPTHYAVAIRYAPDEHPLPRVIAKGADESAAILRREARDAGVPIIGNPPVARALYKVGLDQPIPEELFETVAAILRWVDAIGPRHAAPDEPSYSHQSTDLPC
ncbi:type III secretion protein U [Burkholderia sp. D7]|nr:type III secretion protein U [Burkholderia sp. D7]